MRTFKILKQLSFSIFFLGFSTFAESVPCNLEVKVEPTIVKVLSTSFRNDLKESDKIGILKGFASYQKRTSLAKVKGSYSLTEITKESEYRARAVLNNMGQGAYYLLALGTGGLGIIFMDEEAFNDHSTTKYRWIAQVLFKRDLTVEYINEMRCKKLLVCLAEQRNPNEISILQKLAEELHCQ
jgi:hypothetical protein